MEEVTKDELLAHAEKVLGPLAESAAMIVFNDGHPHPFGMVELGFGVMHDKQIITLAKAGVPMPAHLRAVSAAVVEYEGEDLAPAMAELARVMADLELAPSGMVASNDLDPGHEDSAPWN